MEMRINLEQKESRDIPVFPVFEGTIARGFAMTNQSISPSYVLAEGPRSSLESQYEFPTEKIDIDGRYEDFSVLAGIINNNPLITIHGNRMIEYSASVRAIPREFNYPEVVFNTDDFESEDDSEYGDDTE